MNKTVFFNKFRRLFGFVLTISLLGNVFAASAQNARISIKMENVPISQVIKEIENQTRYLFINKGVDTKNKVSINAVQKTIQDVLAQLFAGTEIAYRIDESYIILTKKNDAGNPVSVTGKIRDAKGNPIVGASILVQGTTIGVSSDAMVRLRFRYPPRSRQTAGNQFYWLYSCVYCRGQPDFFRNHARRGCVRDRAGRGHCSWY